MEFDVGTKRRLDVNSSLDHFGREGCNGLVFTAEDVPPGGVGSAFDRLFGVFIEHFDDDLVGLVVVRCRRILVFFDLPDDGEQDDGDEHEAVCESFHVWNELCWMENECLYEFDISPLCPLHLDTNND